MQQLTLVVAAAVAVAVAVVVVVVICVCIGWLLGLLLGLLLGVVGVVGVVVRVAVVVHGTVDAVGVGADGGGDVGCVVHLCVGTADVACTLAFVAFVCSTSRSFLWWWWIVQICGGFFQLLLVIRCTWLTCKRMCGAVLACTSARLVCGY